MSSSPRYITFRYPLTALAVAGALAMASAPLAASAATITYVNGTLTSSYQLVTPSGSYTKNGGWATCSGNHIALMVNERTVNATGLSVLYQGTAAKCGPVSYTHPAVGGVRPQCRWYWTGSGPAAEQLALTCKRYTP
jgi:hypothetical protein